MMRPAYICDASDAVVDRDNPGTRCRGADPHGFDPPCFAVAYERDMRARWRRVWQWVGFLAACIVAICGLCVWAARADAHDLWRNGDPIPAWVKSSCCGAAGAHNLPGSDVAVTRSGYVVAGRLEPIPFDKALPSPDGTIWIFYAGDIATAPIYCFFVPPEGV